jgi:hypothetical protein
MLGCAAHSHENGERMNKVKALLAGAGIALGIAVVPAAPAFAVPSCGSGYICFYNGHDGTSLLQKTLATSYVRSICYTHGSSPNVPSGISYVVNDSAYSFPVYKNSACSGTSSALYAHSYGPMNSSWDNAINSMFRA